MLSMKKLAAGAATSVLALSLISAAAHAQEISGGISGAITDDAGRPLAGVRVAITYEPTRTTLSATTNGAGFYNVQNLPVGGPYRIVATDNSHASKSVEIPEITIGSAYQLNLSLAGAGAPPTETTVAGVTVTGSRIAGGMVQTGPRSTFTAADIQTLPTFQRDLKDVARLNPFVTIDPTNSNALIIAGSNPRASTIYVDGVKQSDTFGLNGNGYPTQRSPISIDDVKAFNVEVAPYDVYYGEFQGGVLNIVTKSGTNTFHGGGFIEYDDHNTAGYVIGARAVNQPNCPNGAATGSFTGASQAFNTTATGSVNCGDRLLNPTFRDKNYGFNLGGPIWRDHLFFFGSYEKYEGIAPTPYVPNDVAGSNPVPGVTSADIANVTGILKSVYGYNPGSYGGGSATTDEKYFGKLDWFINDNQHLFVSYQNTKGNALNFPNGSTSSSAGILPLSTNFYNLQQNLEVYTADLTSHWTSNFSTELEYTHETIDTITGLQGDPHFAEFKIKLPSGASIYAGPDVSRQANKLGTTDQQFKIRGNYTLGSNVITVGYEREDAKAFDLFVQNANGTYTFDNTCGGAGATGLTNLQNRTACNLVYQNAYDNNPLTAAATETTAIDTFYLQDEWRPLSNLSLKAGLRYERYSTDKVPLLNPAFQARYGFPNTATLDGRDILMPRFGFNWRPDPTLTVSGGFGLFSGGNPTVYFYNSFDTIGNLVGSVNCVPTTCPAGALNNVNGDQVPASIQAANTASAARGAGTTSAVDPRFKVPSEWKASLTVVKSFDLSRFKLGGGWRAHLDYLYKKTKDGLNFVDQFELAHISPTPAPDGRPQFDRARYTGVVPPYDIVLTNTHKGGGNVVAVGIGNSWSNGVDFDLTYRHEDVKEITPATSSVAVSNYRQLASMNPNNPELALSNYNTDHDVKLSLGFSRKWFGDNRTSVRLYGEYRSGLPFSYTFQQAYVGSNGLITTSSTGNTDQVFGQSALAASGGNELLYVPKTDDSGNVTVTSDPAVRYATNFDVVSFNKFLHDTGLIKYAGGISPRNAFTSKDYTTFDLSFTQEFPAFFPGGAKGELYFDFFNIGNFLNKNWGVIAQTGFPGTQAPVQAVNCQAGAQPTGAGAKPLCAAGTGNFYEYRPGSTTTQTLGSTSGGNYYPAWRLKVGIRYKF